MRSPRPAGILQVGTAAAATAVIALGATAAMSSAVDVAAQSRLPSHLVIVSDRDGDNDVYSIRADGRRVGALTRNRVADKNVLLSPAGGWLVVERPSGLVLVRADGRWERKLGGSTYAATFSPDGRRLAFARETDFFEETSRIELIELRHTDGRSRTIRPTGRLADMELEEVGLFYAYTTTGPFRGRVVFVPFDRLLP